MPESAAFDADSQQIFVSNVNHYAKDGNGFVSKVSADGQIVELKWLQGLNSPTGLTVRDGLLYVVDYDQLHIVDIESAEIKHSVVSPDKKPALNDVAVSIDGQVFVTGSASSSIYHLQQNTLEVWKQDDEALKFANGLFVKNETLVFGGLNWLIFDLKSKQLINEFMAPEPTIIDIDGITSDGCGGYFITLIGDDRLWRVDSFGKAAAVSDNQIKGIDIQRYQDRLFIPTVGGGLSVFTIEGTCQ